MPKFSILIPTRNRASLLRQTLFVNVRQDFEDYEIIVSDNNSKDNTCDIVNEVMLTTDKIKYFNTGKDLSMPDNFEFALNKASGDYILILCDDDVLATNSLKTIELIQEKYKADVIVWKKSYYHFGDVSIKSRRGEFKIEKGTRQVYSINSKAVQKSFEKIKIDFNKNPRFINCIISKQAVQKCKNVTGRFFIPPYPDCTTTCQVISNFPSYLYVDMPLFVNGTSILSNASLYYRRKEKLDDFFNLLGEDILEHLDYSMKYLNATYVRATTEIFNKLHKDSFHVEIDFEEYFLNLYNELLLFSGHEDISEEESEIRHMVGRYFMENKQRDDIRHKMVQMKKSRLSRKKLRDFIQSSKLINGIISRMYYWFQKFKMDDSTLYYGHVGDIGKAADILTKFVESHIADLMDRPLVIVDTVDEYFSIR